MRLGDSRSLPLWETMRQQPKRMQLLSVFPFLLSATVGHNSIKLSRNLPSVAASLSAMGMPAGLGSTVALDFVIRSEIDGMSARE